MNTIEKLLRKALFAALLCSAAFVAACSDDEKPAAPLTLADLEGSYVGTFDFTPAPSDLNPAPVPERGVAVDLRVENGEVLFPEFPAATLVKALVGEEGAAGLLPMLGKITYAAPIGTPTADSETLTAALTTPVLRLDVGGVLVVLITIEAPDTLRYTGEGVLTFALRTTQCQLGEGASAGAPFDLVNELRFTVRKQ